MGTDECDDDEKNGWRVERQGGVCDGIVGWPVMHHVAGSQAQLAERFSGAGALVIVDA
jgi:hypothetical protein